MGPWFGYRKPCQLLVKMPPLVSPPFRSWFSGPKSTQVQRPSACPVDAPVFGITLVCVHAYSKCFVGVNLRLLLPARLLELLLYLVSAINIRSLVIVFHHLNCMHILFYVLY